MGVAFGGFAVVVSAGLGAVHGARRVAVLGAGLSGGLVAGLVVGPLMGLGAGLVGGVGGGLGAGLGIGLAGELAVMVGTGLAGELAVVVSAGLVGVLGAVLGAVLGVGPGARLGALIRSGLKRAFTDFPKLLPYLRLMVRPLLGYTLGYAAIVVWFACIYATLYTLNLQTPSVCHLRHLAIPCDAAFSGIDTPQWSDFLFFTVTIFPPIGAYSGLQPLGLWAHAVVTGELVVGVGYTTVVFAAILAYRTPAFDNLRRWNTQRAIAKHMGLMKADLKADLRRAQEQTHKALHDTATTQQQDLTAALRRVTEMEVHLDQRMERIERQLEELTKQRTTLCRSNGTINNV